MRHSPQECGAVGCELIGLILPSLIPWRLTYRPLIQRGRPAVAVKIVLLARQKRPTSVKLINDNVTQRRHYVWLIGFGTTEGHLLRQSHSIRVDALFNHAAIDVIAGLIIDRASIGSAAQSRRPVVFESAAHGRRDTRQFGVAIIEELVFSGDSVAIGQPHSGDHWWIVRSKGGAVERREKLRRRLERIIRAQRAAQISLGDADDPRRAPEASDGYSIAYAIRRAIGDIVDDCHLPIKRISNGGYAAGAVISES